MDILTTKRNFIAQRKAIDAVVAPSGGDYSDIQAADNVLDAADYSLYVKPGTYATFAVSTDDARVEFGPGVVITGVITLSGDNIVLVINPGCDIQGVVTVSGIGCKILIRNAITAVGFHLSGNFGYLNGGGWDSIVDGLVANDAIKVTGTDCIVEDIAANTTTGGASAFIAFATAGARTIFRRCKVINSDSHGFSANGGGTDMLVEGCTVLDADGWGVQVNDPRGKIIGNEIFDSDTGGILCNASGDDSVVIGNIVKQGGATSAITVDTNGENCTVEANRTDGVVTDASGTSTVVDNDETVF